MDGVSFAFAVFQTVDLCLKYGKLLIEKYRTYKQAETRISELILSVEGVWVKTETQIETLRNIWDTLGSRLQLYQSQALQQLQIKLQTAISEIDGVIGSKQEYNFLPTNFKARKGPSKKWKYVAVEECLEKTLADLETWQRRFDPSWFLITRIADRNIDRQLWYQPSRGEGAVSLLTEMRDVLRSGSSSGQSIFLDGNLWAPERSAIPYSSALVSRGHEESGSTIIDTTTYPHRTDMNIAMTHVRDLARLLSKSDPSTFGLLTCRGVSKLTDQFEFLFEVPIGLQNPRSLRHMLLEPTVSLDERFQLARSMARSVMFVHASGFVHKNIRPETIVVFQKEGCKVGFPFLVGFERFRPAAAGSTFQGDVHWERNLYRHPKRQGILPEDLYIMQHDIYSLGICLLEMGLWSSFVLPYENTDLLPRRGPLLDISIQISTIDVETAFEIKRLLVRMAEEILPSRMGNTYTDIVISCLTCLDPGESNIFGKESDLQDEDGIVVGVQYIEKVLLQLEGISV